MTSSIDREKLLIEMVMRQTEYSYEEACEKLKTNNNNYISVIREYMGIEKTQDKSVKSINQHVYKEIRGLMDTAAYTYRRKQEMEKQKEELKEKLREEYNRRESIKKENNENKKLELIEEIRENVEDQETEEASLKELD